MVAYRCRQRSGSSARLSRSSARCFFLCAQTPLGLVPLPWVRQVDRWIYIYFCVFVCICTRKHVMLDSSNVCVYMSCICVGTYVCICVCMNV